MGKSFKNHQHWDDDDYEEPEVTRNELRKIKEVRDTWRLAKEAVLEESVTKIIPRKG